MSGLRVVLLAKDRHVSEPALRRFLAVGAVRGHTVQWLDKQAFLAADLARVDVVCLKSPVDDDAVWRKIDVKGVRAVNRRAANMACADRAQLDAMLRADGMSTPRSAATAAEVAQLRLPIVRKPRAASAPREVRVLSAGGRRQAMPMDPALAETARHVGRLTGLEVHGLDFVGTPDHRALIDVNPFPSFRCVPQAADALWEHLEQHR